jgi:tRNA-2-methylthio-N6-dimethylallyladenosine synthase
MKYYIITYGCQMNKSDSERLASQLEKKGYRPAATIGRADLAVINACSVRQSAVHRINSKIKQLKEQKKKIFLTGCILEKDRKEWEKQVDRILPFAGLEIKPKYSIPTKAFVPIMTGCNNFCSYCVVPYVRGREYSRPAEKIIRQIKCLVKNGCKEITLLGQNVNSYQGKVNFPELLRLICRISGDFQIKFMTSHPKDMSDKLIKVIAESDKIAKEIHLPVQSGDNRILKKMNRGYTAAEYKKLAQKIRKKIPQVELSTDIIVGFPGETKKQFANTVKLLKEICFSQIYAAAYSPRSGAAASKLKDDVLAKEKKRRKKIVLGMIRKK